MGAFFATKLGHVSVNNGMHITSRRQGSIVFILLAMLASDGGENYRQAACRGSSESSLTHITLIEGTEKEKTVSS
jgi:hypothetical protein